MIIIYPKVFTKKPKNFDEAVKICTKLSECSGITYKK